MEVMLDKVLFEDGTEDGMGLAIETKTEERPMSGRKEQRRWWSHVCTCLDTGKILCTIS
jgi:hypothetical protein